MGSMAMDSPLRRWRRSQGLTQAELAERLGVHMSTVAKYEQRFRVPREDELATLAEVTGLSLEAILFPERYLREHPEYLEAYAEQPPRRGRYPRQRPPEEGTPEAPGER
jgi:transcriptional regulator with XRE-family HTH domain